MRVRLLLGRGPNLGKLLTERLQFCIEFVLFLLALQGLANDSPWRWFFDAHVTLFHEVADICARSKNSLPIPVRWEPGGLGRFDNRGFTLQKAEDYIAGRMIGCRDICLLIADLIVPSGSDGDDPFKPVSWFLQKTNVKDSRLRQAARKNRKTMRVRATKEGGLTRYSVVDARKNWPADMNEE